MQIELVATDVDLSFLPDIEDVHLGGGIKKKYVLVENFH